MALTADYTKINDYENVVYIRNARDDNDAGITLNPVTHSLVFACMAIGLGEITEKNATEYAVRLRAWENGTGTFLQKPDENGNLVPRAITWPEVQQHIGLRTNAFPNLSKAAFAKKLTEVMTDQAARQVKKEQS